MPVLIFAGDTYYPDGGAADLIGVSPTWASAIDVAKSRKLDWWQILSLPDGRYLDSEGESDTLACFRGLQIAPEGHAIVPIEPTNDILLCFVEMAEYGPTASYAKAEELWGKIMEIVGSSGKKRLE